MAATRSTAATRSLGRCVLVPVANPASVRPLLELAADLADPDGAVVLLTVLRPDAAADEHSHAWQGMAEAEELATTLGVRVRGEVRTDPALGDAVLQAISERGASLVLMGWRGASSTTDVFGRLIDHVVGRSSVPLAVVRLGTVPRERILLPISADHLLPGGAGGLNLAVDMADRLRRRTAHPTTVLRTGTREPDLPESVTALGDRVHHDPRRTHQAVAAFASPDDLIVAPVAPTVSGLRAATTHLAWAAPDATLLVAIDVGPTADEGLADAVAGAGRPAPARTDAGEGTTDIRIVVTVRLPDDREVTPEQVERVLASTGRTDHLMAWWPAGDPRPHVRATVELAAADSNGAIAKVMTALHEAPELAGSEITYDLDRSRSHRPRRDRLAVRDGDVEVADDVGSDTSRTAAQR
ncbi:MAG: universal stress protein [Nitriliruptoraceae bacterium]